MYKSIAGEVSFDLMQKEISAIEFIHLRQVLCLAREKDIHSLNAMEG
ncbi:MAG: hypothetical protein K0U24_07755 [Gammaproteobacteria bacterium]|nr:hypothetical protein [Gammaproteobacteria bacterium]MCH9764094.1 hypothetical protein [Gammaproteobacteria bacterium]